MEKIELNLGWSSLTNVGVIVLGLLTIFLPNPLQAAELPDNFNTAQVLKVEARGKPSAYNFAVTISSPDSNRSFPPVKNEATAPFWCKLRTWLN